jgi:2-dehydropantoate 2-reductase
MRVLILGAGAVGGYFGGRLIEAGVDVKFLVRPGRATQLAEQGLQIESRFGNIVLPIQPIMRIDADDHFDLVILPCKAYDLQDAIRAVGPALEHARIVPLLNGLQHLEMLDDVFGAEKVLGGLCHLSVTMRADGVIEHMNDYHHLTIGGRSAGQAEFVQQIQAVFQDVKFNFKISSNITAEMWEKYAFLATFAGMTCLMRGTVGEISQTAHGQALTRKLLATCAHVAQRSGYPLEQAWFDRNDDFLTQRNSHATASMLRDIKRGGRTEADHIIGDMLRRAESHGIQNDLLQIVYTHLKIYENQQACD